MKIIKLNKLNEKVIIKRILKGDIFIYPTDTLYGIGCNALNHESVLKIRDIKKSTKPFSVIVPSKKWIYQNLYAKSNYIEKLPGPFTYIFKVKKKGIVDKAVSDLATLGIRIPDNKFTVIVQKSKVPFVTTSVNITGKKPISNIKKIPKSISNKVDIIIDAGILNNNPSIIIDLTDKVAKIIR